MYISSFAPNIAPHFGTRHGRSRQGLSKGCVNTVLFVDEDQMKVV